MKNGVANMLSKLYAQRPAKKVTVFTTAGTTLFSQLLGVSGASSTVLEFTVPYSRASSMELLKDIEPQQFCSVETAAMLATTAYERSAQLATLDALEGNDPVSLLDMAKETLPHCVGLACSAALVSNVPKKGDHRCYVAACSADGIRSYSLILEKGLRDRVGEDNIAAQMLLHAFMESCYDKNDFDTNYSAAAVDLAPSEEIVVNFLPHPNPVTALLDKKSPVQAVLYLPSSASESIDAPQVPYHMPE